MICAAGQDNCGWMSPNYLVGILKLDASVMSYCRDDFKSFDWRLLDDYDEPLQANSIVCHPALAVDQWIH